MENDEINKSLSELQEELGKLKTAAELIQIAKESAEKTVNETKEKISELINQSKEVTEKVVKESRLLNEKATRLLDSTEVLTKKLDKVDFPIRLDKIDVTVSGINLGLQNLSAQMDSVEKHIAKQVENLGVDLLKKSSGLSKKINWILVLNIIIVLICFLITISK